MTTHTFAASRHRGTGQKLFRAFANTMTFFLFVAFVGGVAYGLYRFAIQSRTFNVRTVHIEGACFLQEADILAQSGITSDDNLLFLNVSSVRDRMLAIPYVRTCEALRTFPDTVTIRIVERVPKATLVVNNRNYEIDEESVVLREIPSGDPCPEPFITNVGGSQAVEPGLRLEQPEIAQALSAWKAFRAEPIAQEITLSEIAALRVNDIRMYFNELPFEVRWGRKDFESQARRFETLWRAKEKWLPCAEYLDLRFDRDVACK